ncbi:MAG TPA: DUF4097 family beta strand repeat-containing protein [Longimicrobium sp.]|nr:DUF4097 family beta strand repeat-containing protein [Longimicrobium sp.]
MRGSRRSFAAALALSLAAVPAHAQERGDDWVERCRRWNRSDGRQVHCEVRETRLRADGSLSVDGRQNGGVSVRAWDGADVLVRAQIQTQAPSAAEAREIAREITVRTGGETVAAQGPEVGRRQSWSVSYEVFVPRRTNLQLRTNNGPISVNGVAGEMDLQAHNGPLTLREVAGDVRGRTTNGPVTVTLAGSSWSGAGLDVETTNGPVTLAIPEGYSAHLETGTVNGPMSIDFPVTVQGRVTRRISTDLGRGGAPIRVLTTNGPVTVRER